MSNVQAPALWRSKNLRTMVTCAILIAMGTVLSLLKVWEMPLGGSVTPLSMLPICLAGLMFGAKWGFGTAFVYSVLQLLTSSVFAWGLTPVVLVVAILFDYIVAFSVLGVTGFFAKRGKWWMILGIFIAILLRMVCHYITGVTIWKSSMPEDWNNVWLYSLAYNGAYMLPETVFTMAGTFALLSVPRFVKLIKGE